MCVRDLSKGKCRGSKYMKSKEGLMRHTNKAPLKTISTASASRRPRGGGGAARRMKSKAEIDLLCTEFLSHSSNALGCSWTTDLPLSELEAELSSSLVAPFTFTDLSFTSSPSMAMNARAYELVLDLESSPSDFYDGGLPWVGSTRMDDSPPELCCMEDESLDGFKDENQQTEAWNHGIKRDIEKCLPSGEDPGVDWCKFSSDPRFQQFRTSLPTIGVHCGFQCSASISSAVPRLHSGNSFQSKQLLYSTWPRALCPLVHVDKECHPTGSIVNSESQADQLSLIKETNFGAVRDPIFAFCTGRDVDPRLKSLKDDKNFQSSSRSRARISSITRAAVASNLMLRLEFREAMELLRNKETSGSYHLSISYVERLNESFNPGQVSQLGAVRRSFVDWILQIVQLLGLSTMTAARAVSLLDRNLSKRGGDSGSGAQDKADDLEEILLTAVACVWIASKLEDSGTPQLSCIRQIAGLACNDDNIRRMEVSVLKSLGWRMLGVTAGDFLGNMIAHLPTLGLPMNLLPVLAHRSDEILRGLLPEFEFLAYQPSILSFSILQCILDECMPLHTSTFMAAFHLALAVDMHAKEECCAKLMRLPALGNAANSDLQPDANFYRGNLTYFANQLPREQRFSDPDGLLMQSSIHPIPAF